MFYIYTQTFFYSGTINAQKSESIRDNKNTIRTFASKAEALFWLQTNKGEMIRICGSQYQQSGCYILSHGEYARPTYKIRKTRQTTK